MVLWVLLVALQGQSGDVPQPLTGIAAKINGEIVTWDEVELKLRDFGPGERPADLRRSLLRQVAEDRLRMQFVEKYKIKVTDKEVDDAIARDKKQLGGEARFQKFLEFRKMTLSQWIAQRRQDLSIQMLYRRLSTEAVRQPGFRTVLLWDSVTPDELRDYFKKNKEQFNGIEHVTVWRIGLKFGPDDKEEKRRLAESLLRKLNEGTEFGILAHFYSETATTGKNGKVPVMREVKREDTKDFWSPEIQKYVFDVMKAGDTSPILEEPGTFNILFMETRADRKAEDFEEAQLRIRAQLENARREENHKILRDALAAQSFIEPPDLFK